MQQYLSFITLAVSDLARSRDFFLTGLGWQAELDEQDVIFLRVGDGLVLSLWERSSFVAEVGTPVDGLAPVTLAHNVPSDDEVDDVLRSAQAAGAVEVSPAIRREWGGYSGYFVDPDGFHWEVAHLPGELGDQLVAAGRAAAARTHR
ncbi:VOC family protein [Branchiibius sp. NY16-3462-2]|uniref:VOC family protein n=1 Tax=Branchiibius sp. NY16-3462-2 TaxID=1807500 RepID=UPI00079860AF|nr:VOC family protein [Branchiibius sp. NY16-3462-2]KYH46189.1 glyoxalase [Branchiibius sp. NY16-3462-2]